MSAVAGVAGFEVKVAGQALDAALAAAVLDVRVETHLLLPDTALIRIADQDFAYVDGSSFAIGADLTVAAVASDSATLTPLFDGQITTFEPEFTEREVILSVRAYDRSQAMNRTRNTQTFQEMSYGDIARKLAGANGLQPGTIEAGVTGAKFVQQSNETDWAFLWRLATAVGYEVVVDGKKLHFREPKAASGNGVKLTWGDNLQSFRPRVSGVQQVSSVSVRGWDPMSKQAIVGQSSHPDLTSQIGLSRQQLVSSMGGGSVTVVDQPVGSQPEADAVAKSVANRLANAYLEADGTTRGDARLSSGVLVKIDGVGERFGGSYTLTETTHLIRTVTGYQTHFRVSGRVVRGLLDLDSRVAGPSWRNSVVVGVVTNNNDPDGLGRVRVKFPALSDDAEGWWARIATASAGAARGLLMMPVPGDEVLVAFEHGDDEHPYVIGSLWNGQGKPGENLVHTDGSFSLQSTEQILAQATKQISVQGQDTVTVSAQQNMTLNTQQQLSVQATQNGSVQSDAQLTLKGQEGITVQGLTATVQSDTSTKVSGAASVSVESDDSVTIRGATITIQAEGIVQITAPQIMLG